MEENAKKLNKALYFKQIKETFCFYKIHQGNFLKWDFKPAKILKIIPRLLG